MKTKLIALLLTIFFASKALARVFTVSLAHTNDVTEISINGKKMPRDEAIGIYRKLGSLDPNQMVYLIIGSGVPATYMVETIHHLQEAGLHDLVLMSPARIGRKTGMYQITVDSTKRTFGGCIAGVNTESGFHEMPEIDKDPRRKKTLRFLRDGSIQSKQDHNENHWKASWGVVEIYNRKDEIYSKFKWDQRQGRLEHTNDPRLPSVMGQFIVPSFVPYTENEQISNKPARSDA